VAAKKRTEEVETKPKKKSSSGPHGLKKTAARKAAVTGRPRIRSSHEAPSFHDGPRTGAGRTTAGRAPSRAGAAKPRAGTSAAARTRATATPQRKTGEPKARTPLGAPKRAGKKSLVPPPVASSVARELALALAEAALDKKAIGVEILDVSGRVDYADFLVVATGRSDRHVHAIATGIEGALKEKKNVAALSVEGLSNAVWVLIDYGDVVVHVFQEEARALYDIEGLWIDAGRVPVPVDPAAPAAPPAPTRGRFAPYEP